MTRAAPRGVFVTGTDTNVGKTLVSACLVARWGADYWKPAQTGLDEDPGDTATVAHLAAIADPRRIHPPRVALRAPLSVEAAARREGAPVALEAFVLPETAAPLVVEGAGGVLVPISADALMIDLMARFALPAVVVARTALGTINHTLLTLAALRARAIPIAGVVMSGPANAENAADIAHHGRVRILAQIPPLGAVTPQAVARAAAALPAFADLA